MNRLDGSGSMAFCPHCGSPAAAGTSFCASCGRSLAGAPAPDLARPTPPLLAPDPARPVERPVGVTIVGIVMFIGAAFMAFGALFLFLGSQWLAGYVPSSVPEARSIFTVFGPLLALLVLLVAGLAVFAGVGVLQGHGWAWGLVLVLMGLNILGGLGELAMRQVDGVLTLLVSGIVIWYFLRPEVRAWFGQSVAA